MNNSIKDIPANLRHPIDTKRISMNIPKSPKAFYQVQTNRAWTANGHRVVLELTKMGHWYPHYKNDSMDFDPLGCMDKELVQLRKEGKTVLAIIIDYEYTDCTPFISCLLHVEIFNSDPDNRELSKQLVYQLMSRHFCPTDEASNYLWATREELRKELKEVTTMKSDLHKESKSYLTRLTKRVGDIMQDSQPITEETFIAASEKQKHMGWVLSQKINEIHGATYKDEVRMARVATLLADTMIDRLVDSVYQKGIQQSNRELVRAISTVESLMPPEMKYKVPDEFIKLKKEQLALAYEIEVYKREQKEIRRRQLEAEREERRAQKELEKEIKRAQQDELDAQAAIERNRFEMAKAQSEEQVQKFKEKIALLEEALRHAQERHERALSMAQQTKCGYVYVISNIGSFGDNIYKIGMTRRVEPMERVAELSSASVPFPFDVHAMIYTEDAPGLEAELHRAFDDKKVNAVNWRKEYFNVSLSEIRQQVEKIGINCEWVENPSAGQYRDSIRMKERK